MEGDFSKGEPIEHIGLRGRCFLEHGHLYEEMQ